VGGLNVSSAVQLSALEKVMTGDYFPVITSSGYNTSQFSQGSDAISHERTDTHTYQILHKTLKEDGDVYFYAKRADPNLHNIPRVIVELWVANYEKMRVSDTLLTCQQYRHFPVATLREAEVLRALLLTKTYKFIALSFTTGGSFTTKAHSHFPRVDLTRSWTNDQLYDYFSLTQDERTLIESTVK
jgi:hypothetical protein